MAKVKYKTNYAGVGRLLKSPEMRSVVDSNAAKIKKNAGDDYDVKYANTRAVAFVQTGNDKAVQDNLDNNTLLKAVRK